MIPETALAAEFKAALRGVASSVTIFTTSIRGARHGMVATAVMSVSMDPASLIIAVNKSASIHDPITDRGLFCVNVLSEWDASISNGFAKAKGEDRFAFGAWSQRDAGNDESSLPYLVTAQASIFCRTREVYTTHGTHSLFVGDVIDVIRSEEISPLTYCNGQYGSFTEFSSHLVKTGS